jgi:hypothetical protein
LFHVVCLIDEKYCAVFHLLVGHVRGKADHVHRSARELTRAIAALELVQLFFDVGSRQSGEIGRFRMAVTAR